MKLASIEIQGFKTFCDKIKFSFDSSITAIVGPNGSGKSNFSDAMRWVLGENSAKRLRCNKQEELIFSGSKARKAMAKAEVTLYLIDENDDLLSFIKTAENADENGENSVNTSQKDALVSITRRLYRDGTSEYLINGKNVRLRDIHELFMDTGLGKDGYSIIGQGKIDSIVSDKTSERREIFEEAAGISKIRYRREESEKRLSASEEKLVFVENLILEIENRLTPLKEQAKKAHEFVKLAELKKNSELTLWAHILARFNTDIKAFENEIFAEKNNLEKCKNELEELENKSNDLYFEQNNISAKMDEERKSNSENERKSLDLQAKINNLESDIRFNERENSRLLERIDEIEGLLLETASKSDESDKLLSELEERLTDANSELFAIEDLIKNVKLKIKEASDAKTKFSEINLSLKDNQNRINTLSSISDSMELFYRSVKIVIEGGKKGILSGILGTVADKIEVEQNFSLAIETALGASAQNIITEKEQDAKKAIFHLKEKKGGRATFLPLDNIKNAHDSKKEEFTINEIEKAAKSVGSSDFLGVASKLVKFDEKYKFIISQLLSRTIIVTNLDYGSKLAKALNYKYKIIALDGNQINAGGSLTGGDSSKSSGIITQKAKLEKLKEERIVLQKELEACQNVQNSFKQNIIDLVLEKDILVTPNESESEIIDRLVDYKTKASIEVNNINNEIKNAKEKSLDRVSKHNNLISEKEKILEKLKNLDKENEAKNEEIKAIKLDVEKIFTLSSSFDSRISALTTKRLDLEKEQEEIRLKLKDLDRQKESLLGAISKIEEKKIKLEAEEENIISNLWNEYEITKIELAQQIKLENDFNENKTKAYVAQLRQQIKNLGDVNVAAIEEEKEVSARYEMMSAQLKDIKESITQLKSVIENLTSHMKELFLEKFHKINENFKEMFKIMFAGGEASLELEDDKNPLTCGILIHVHPPGKVVKSLESLSGGEKAMVAMSLYFSIMKVNPPPFCIMDEIEAALDEGNVVRFASYLRSMIDSTQFVAITHRRGTMEEADVLYGVTMQEQGISKVLKMSLKELTERHLN